MSTTLETRLERLEKVAGPADPPCFSVEITRESSHLLTAGEEGAEDTRPARKRRAGHVCGEHCVRVTINRRVKPETVVSAGTHGDAPAPQLALPAPEENASTEPGRGDAQPGQERVAADRVTDAQPGPPRSTTPAYGPGEGSGDIVLGGRARDAVVEMGRTAPPALVSPLALEMRHEADARAAALSRDVQSMVPWWLPVAEAPLGPCAVPYCGHPALEHRGPRTRLPCRVCGFRAEQHNPDGIALEVPWASRRVSPCALYRAICVDSEDSDRCEREGCGCPGWRRVPPYVSEHEARLRALLDEKDRIIASNAEELARLRAEYEAEQSEMLRAQGTRSLGASPQSCPVYTDEVSR